MNHDRITVNNRILSADLPGWYVRLLGEDQVREKLDHLVMKHLLEPDLEEPDDQTDTHDRSAQSAVAMTADPIGEGRRTR